MAQTRLRGSQVFTAIRTVTTASGSLQAADDGALLIIDAAGAHTLTIPHSDTRPFRVGAWVLVAVVGGGPLTVAAATDVTALSVAGLDVALGGCVWLRQVALNEWSVKISGTGLGEDAGGPGAVGGDYYDEIMARANLDTYLRFDETSPATAFDASGNGNNAIYSGTYTLDEAAIVDGGSASVLLNGGEIKNSSYTFTDGDFSIDQWVNFAALPNGAALWFIGRTSSSVYDDHRTLLGFADGTEYGYSAGGNYPFIGSINGDENGWEIAADDSAVVTATDYHFVTTYDASDAVLSLWVNKELLRTLPLYQPINRNELHIGRRPDDGGNNDDINGRCDEFVITNRVLTEQEIVDAYDIGSGLGVQPPLSGPPAPSAYAALIAAKNVLAWYPCDELVPKACFDASGNGNTGRYEGSATFQDSAIVDGGKNIATLNGTDGFIRTFSTPFGQDDQFTVEVFFELDTIPNGEGIWSFHNVGITYSGPHTVYPRILTLGCCDGVNPMTPGGNTLYLRMATPQYVGSQGYVYNMITDVVLATATKYHAVIVFDKHMVSGSQYSRMRLYVNNVLKGEQDGIYFQSARYGFSIGRRIDNMGNRNFAHGRIHSAVYSDVFSASDVTDHYNAAMGI